MTDRSISFAMNRPSYSNIFMKVIPLRSRCNSIHRRMVINLCLGIYIAQAEDEEFSVVDTVQLGSESFDL